MSKISKCNYIFKIKLTRILEINRKKIKMKNKNCCMKLNKILIKKNNYFSKAFN